MFRLYFNPLTQKKTGESLNSRATVLDNFRHWYRIKRTTSSSATCLPYVQQIPKIVYNRLSGAEQSEMTSTKESSQMSFYQRLLQCFQSWHPSESVANTYFECCTYSSLDFLLCASSFHVPTIHQRKKERKKKEFSYNSSQEAQIQSLFFHTMESIAPITVMTKFITWCVEKTHTNTI